MPVLEIENEYVIPITYDCNWNCPYCAVKNDFDQKFKTDFTPVERRLSLVPETSSVTIAGGEPGLVSRESLEEYLKILEMKKCQIYLETNGTFLDRYPDLICRFKEISYHCSVNMDIPMRVTRGYGNIRYLLIVNDDNIGNLRKFLEFNPDVKFDVIECTYPHGITGPTLSGKNKNMILANFGRRLTSDSIRRLIHGKNFERAIWLS